MVTQVVRTEIGHQPRFFDSPNPSLAKTHTETYTHTHIYTLNSDSFCQTNLLIMVSFSSDIGTISPVNELY